MLRKLPGADVSGLTPMEPVTVAVIGLGSIGLRHARNLHKLGHRVLGFDPSPQARQQFVIETGGDTAERHSVLSRADAVVVASPSRVHLQDLADTIAAGKPALVEKPLGHSAEVANAILQRAERAGLVVAVVQNLRFRVAVMRVRELLGAGRIGRPIWANFECGSWLPDWRPCTDYRQGYAADRETGGVIFDNIHEIDLAVHLLGPAELCAAVASRTGLLDIASEDMADIVLEHEDGCQTRIHIDFVTRPRRRCFTITGTGGVMSVDLRTGILSIIDADDSKTADETVGFDVNAEYVAVIEDFLNAVRTGAPPACPANEALIVLQIACAARRLAGLPSALAMSVNESALP